MAKVKTHIPKPIIKNIAFFGDAHVTKTDPVYKDAYEIAKILAKEGYTIVNGGGPGVMHASTKGAEDGHGETISVTFYPESATGFEGRYVGNITDVEIKTSNYIERMFKLIEHSDMFIIFKGGTGTISELGTSWVLAKLYHGHHKPFILYGSFWKKIIEALKEGLNLEKDELNVFKIVEKRQDVLPVIKKFQKDLNSHDHSDCFICKGEECAFIR